MNTRRVVPDVLRPAPLRAGDRVAIVAPASPVDPAEVSAGLDLLQERGLESVLGENLRNLRSQGLYAAPLEQRVRELMWAFSDRSIAAILVASGGFGCAQILPYLDYGLIRGTPKILMGFSDVTALNTGLLAKTGLVTFNGPSASIRQTSDEVKKSDSEALLDALDLLMTLEPWGEAPFRRNRGFPRCVSSGAASGRVVGGNLTTFQCLLGTPYVPDLAGAILFLEDVREGGYELARSLTHLRLAGVFQEVAGMVVGEFPEAPEKVDEGDPSIEDVLVEFLTSGPPVVYGFNFSHGPTGAVLPVGGTAHLHAEEGKVWFESPLAG